MKIVELINEDLINLDLQAQTKPAVVKELVDLLAKNGITDDAKTLYDVAMAREAHSSTGVGFGIAIPHAKTEVVKKASLVFGRSKTGIDYESMDDEPAFIFFLIAVPNTNDDLHLKTLAALSRKLIDEEFREGLLNASSKEAVLDILSTLNKEE